MSDRNQEDEFESNQASERSDSLSDLEILSIATDHLEEEVCKNFDNLYVHLTLKSSKVVMAELTDGCDLATGAEKSALILLSTPLERKEQLALVGKRLKIRLIQITGNTEINNPPLESSNKLMILFDRDFFLVKPFDIALFS